MDINQQPVVPGVLTEVKQLMGGHKGVLYRFTNTQGDRVVFKFQDESPAEAVAGTRVVAAAGAATPRIRRATDADFDALKAAAVTFKSAAALQFAYPRKQWRHRLLMDFASGSTLMAMRTNALDEFLAAIADPGFQRSLGKIVAADVFAGNPDRMFAGKIEENEKRAGWYHEQNLFIDKSTGGPRAVAIDNAFAPKPSNWVVQKYGAWGRYGQGFQEIGFAGALPNRAVEQAFLIFDFLLATALDNHPDATDQIAQARTHRSGFAKNVAESSLETIEKLMRPGQSWKQNLREDGASQQVLGDFRIRKRMLRLLKAGASAVDALETAKSDGTYRKWLLQTRYKMAGEEADELLAKGVEAYKAFRHARD